LKSGLSSLLNFCADSFRHNFRDLVEIVDFVCGLPTSDLNPNVGGLNNHVIPAGDRYDRGIAVLVVFRTAQAILAFAIACAAVGVPVAVAAVNLMNLEQRLAFGGAPTAVPIGGFVHGVGNLIGGVLDRGVHRRRAVGLDRKAIGHIRFAGV